ncbi:RNA polymerase sigma factor [Enterococcus sp. LJL128]
MAEKKYEEKFIQLYHSYVDEVYKFVYLRTGLNPQLAEDVTQDIFLEVYKSLKTFKGLSSERTWLFKIARNRLNDYYRKQYKHFSENTDINNEELQTIPDSSQDIELELIKEYDKQLIRTCLNSLSPYYQLILTMKYLDDLSVKQMAELLGKTTKSVESVLYRAKQAYIKEYLNLGQEEYRNENKK